MRTRGDWPGRLTLRSGWAKAGARPWNDSSPDASLRLERGSAEFVVACAEHLCSLGVRRVLSPPLDRSSSKVWREAGFEATLPLDLYRRSLLVPIPEPLVDVTEGSPTDWAATAALDDAAFADEWRMGRLGLDEARDATPEHGFLVTRDGDDVSGFVIVGKAMASGYLQRLAVDPARRHQGLGRSLVRAACRWAAARGALGIVLNTQPENSVAGALYRAEGFEVAERALAVFGREC